jgi:hypothetical protein
VIGGKHALRTRSSRLRCISVLLLPIDSFCIPYNYIVKCSMLLSIDASGSQSSYRTTPELTDTTFEHTSMLASAVVDWYLTDKRRK